MSSDALRYGNRVWMVVKTAATNRPLTEATLRRNALASFIAYLRFCQNTPMYSDSLANNFR